MCGIAGIFGSGQAGLLRAMLQTLPHRGPDDGFLVAGEQFALGARRLSIVDVNGGRQPLSNEGGTIWAAQNGELYNYPQVYPRLLADGHQLHTHCDTEILPHLYEQYGPDFVQHIDGMFAVAIWDEQAQQGVLARDRMGKKPLYYHQHEGLLYFASEIKALLALPHFQRRINPQALHHYLSLKHVPCPLSIFEGIQQLPPAHRLIFSPEAPPKIEAYWRLTYNRPELAGLSEAEAAEELLRLLQAGVKRRLMGDVPIGFFLSGGVDSSLTTAMAAELSPQAIKTFTLTYSEEASTPGKEADRQWASWVAQKYATDHHEEQISFRHFPDSIAEILRFFDEPFAGVISTYFLSERVSQYVKVALAGDGADELFGSYRSHRLAFPMAHYPSDDPAALRPFEGERDYLEALYEPQDWQWRYKLLVMGDEEKQGLYSREQAALAKSSSYALMEHYFSQLSARDPLNRMLEAEFRTIFADQVLTFVDRLSMAHSLELRAPFLDTALVEFVAGLPGHLKMKDGVSKSLLKQAALKYFPPEMLFRSKEGFLMPITQWIFYDLRDYVRQTLAPQTLQQQGIFDPQAVQNLITQVYAGQADYMQVNKLYGLVVFQEWYRAYMA
jgi:asparagine synthase (glutamine-hydrolysing)